MKAGKSARRHVLCTALVAMLGCGDSSRSRFTVTAPATWQSAIDDFLALSELDQLPASVVVNVVQSDVCSQCYEVTASPDAASPDELQIAAGGILGAQYGLAAWLESQGVRFVHPYYTHIPGRFVAEPTTLVGEPDIDQRGLHLHTLHPIEALFDFWVDESDDIRAAKRVIDWLIKNRGNYLTWPALDDIDDPERHARWYARTKTIIEYGHARGISLGMDVQLFSSGSLQRALYLVDIETTPEDEIEATLRERLQLLSGLGLDELGISFGEFSQAEPEDFIALATSSAEIAKTELDLERVHATIHVGDDLRTDYMGENLIYYFLVKYVPNLTPWVHTVMYFNLTDPASGAYHHADFHEHRDFLYQKIRAGEEVTYFPESAYWIAFDNTVPMYLPVYPLSRWLDLKQTQDATGKLPTGHVIFSSGWEWGYWQTDVMALQASYELPATFEQQVTSVWSSWRQAEPITDLIVGLAETQRMYLLQEELSGYFAGWDTVLNIGALADIVSQPLVIRPHRLARADAPTRTAFTTDILTKMQAYLQAQGSLIEDFDEAAGMELEDRVLLELRDGVAITALRSKYVATLYEAASLGLDGGETQISLLELAEEIRAEAAIVVELRKGRFWDPNPERLVSSHLPNPTIYPYGYLWPADTLCYWDREMVELKDQLGLTEDGVPDCTVISLGR